MLAVHTVFTIIVIAIAFREVAPANAVLVGLTTVVGFESTKHCSIIASTLKTMIAADRYCEVRKNIAASEFDAAFASHFSTDNFRDVLYYKTTFNWRYVTSFDLDSFTLDDQVSFTVALEVSDGIVTIPTYLTFNIQRSSDSVVSFSAPNSDWSSYSVTFPRSPSLLTPSVISIRTVFDDQVPSEFSGYVEIRNISIEHFPQPERYHLIPQTAYLHDGTIINGDDQHCDALGTANAVILNRIIIEPTLRQSESVFCGVYTIERNHDRVKMVRDTWARKCTSFLAFSDVADASIPSVSLPHLGVEGYHNIWQKMRSLLMYIHHHYIEEYEYFLIGGDDMYYIMENLYQYLDTDEIRALKESGNGVYLGREYDHNDGEVIYNTGGPGYVLDRAAMKVLVNGLNRCNTKIFDSCEDVFVAFCLKGLAGILPYNTSDSFNRQRWHNFPPGYFVYPESSQHRMRLAYLGRDIHLKYGEECCSNRSVAFHYLQPEVMQTIDDYLYRCPQEVKDAYYQRMGADYYDSTSIMTLTQFY